MQELYLPETRMLAEMLTQKTYDKTALVRKCKENQRIFEETDLTVPLRTGSIRQILQNAARLIGERMPLC